MLAENKSQPKHPQLPYQPNTAGAVFPSPSSATLCELQVDHRDQADREDHSWKILRNCWLRINHNQSIPNCHISLTQLKSCLPSLSAILCKLQMDHRDHPDHKDHSCEILEKCWLKLSHCQNICTCHISLTQLKSCLHPPLCHTV